MFAVTKASLPHVLTTGLLCGATLAGLSPAAAVTVPASSLAVTRSGNYLNLSFQTTSPGIYTVQTCPGLGEPWANFQSGIQGDGTVKTVTVTNALLAGQGFYRLLVQSPTNLLLPQASAFSILGHSCGGIKEQAYVTGFDPGSGYPTGDVYLSTTCSTGGRGSIPATYTAWAAVTWDFAGNAASWATASNGPAVNPTFAATDAYGDIIHNAGGAAYLFVPIPAAPTGVTAVQSGDQFQVSWTPTGVNPVAVKSSILTATPVNSTAPVLTTNIVGPTSNGSIPLLQPQTTYQVTVVNTTIGGASPASAPVSVTTAAATILPSAPTNLTAQWTDLNPTGTTDTLVAGWQAADPGNSPIDAYQVTISGSDGGGTFTQTVPGTTLNASFTVDWVPNWSVRVQAHNAAGWGPLSAAVTLGGL